MHDRLKQFLTMEGLSPARFAEVMGIQRSGISHLLAGRNKPSFEFIQRMMTAYPDINYEWLILGKGRPYKSDRPVPESAQNVTLFTETEVSDPDLDADLLPEDQPLEPQNGASQPAENRKFDADTPLALSGIPRKIARIIVFFNDGTYEEK
ncbi:MAG: helix-turn-helix transcriptional regulator [Bacteroidales bacterium]|nr:helix-turn-helix transcriptional regulator [Bacteroidales bacterium]